MFTLLNTVLLIVIVVKLSRVKKLLKRIDEFNHDVG